MGRHTSVQDAEKSAVLGLGAKLAILGLVVVLVFIFMVTVF